jgi:hypothetical protein
MSEAESWYFAWWLTVANMPSTKAVRWEKRVTWARHRVERQKRERMLNGPRCGYCERPGHDETKKACIHRTMEAKRWNVFGKMWSRKGTP